MRPTTQQLAVLQKIQAGLPVTAAQDRSPLGTYPLEVHAYQHSRDGEAMLAHRTVLREDATPETDPRLAFRTELYRVQRDGSVTRL